MRKWSSPETAERVLVYLHEHRDDTGQAAASLPTIAAAVNVSPNTVNVALHRLLDTSALAITRKPGGRLYPTRYRVLRAPEYALAEQHPIPA